MRKGSLVRPKKDIQFDPNPERKGRPVGRVLGVKAGIAKVTFHIPNFPEICDNCSNGMGLSRSGSTGEIECMNSGCGKGFGFQDVVKEINLSDLTVARSGRNIVAERELKKDLNTLLSDAVSRRTIPRSRARQAMALLNLAS